MSLKVLIVDDDVMIVFLHRRMLKQSELSLDPLAFENGKLVLDYLDTNADISRPHLIFLDLNMPVMDGWALLDAIQIRPYSASISVVIVTSSIDPAERRKADRYPQVVDFIEKPLSIAACNGLRERFAVPGVEISKKEI